MVPSGLFSLSLVVLPGSKKRGPIGRQHVSGYFLMRSGAVDLTFVLFAGGLT